MLTKNYKIKFLEIPTILVICLGYMFWLFSIYIRLYCHAHYTITIPISILGVYTLFTPLHEAVHNNISNKQIINYCLGEIIVLPYFFSNFKTFKILHLKHHANTNHKTLDPDYFSRFGIISCMFIVIHYYYFFIHNAYTTNTLIYNGFINSDIMYIGIKWSLLYIGYINNILNHLLVLWVIPSFIGIGLLAYIFDYLPHRNHTHIEPHKHTKMTDGCMHLNDKRGNGIISLLTCNQLTYHHVHHLHPKLAFYNYNLFWKRSDDRLREKYSFQTII